MSMAVDLSTPLTKQEREYLAERGRYDDITRADQMHGVEGQSLPEGDGSGPVLQQTSLNDVRDAKIAELERQLALLTGGATSEPEPESEDDVAPYEEWTVAELDAELKRRKLPVKGDKEAKVTALYDHDDAAGN